MFDQLHIVILQDASGTLLLNGCRAMPLKVCLHAIVTSECLLRWLTFMMHSVAEAAKGGHKVGWRIRIALRASTDTDLYDSLLREATLLSAMRYSGSRFEVDG